MKKVISLSTLIFAHRGASKIAPENTMAAFKKASEFRADGIELDVQLSKDGVPVIIHDEYLDRTTNGSGLVKDFNLKDLKKLDAGRWFNEKYSSETIPTLEEFLTWFSATELQLNIELKTDLIAYDGIETLVYDIVRKFELESRTVFSSFNINTLKRVKHINPSLNTAYLFSKWMNQAWAYAKAQNMDGIHPKYYLLSRRLIQYAHRSDMQVRTYTVNHPAKIKRCYNLKVDAIFTDTPDLAYVIRKNML